MPTCRQVLLRRLRELVHVCGLTELKVYRMDEEIWTVAVLFQSNYRDLRFGYTESNRLGNAIRKTSFAYITTIMNKINTSS